MQFDWSTFVLEVVNFLILLWILKHFFYQPVLTVIRQRKQAVEQVLAEAEAGRQESETLKTQYENRLGDWGREKESARTALREELAAERSRLLEGVQQEISQERQKAEAVEARRQEEFLQSLQQQALNHGSAFVTRMLERLATPELETRIVELALQDLASLPAEQRQTVNRAIREEAVAITTAFPLGDKQRQALTAALSTLAEGKLQPEFREDNSLMAGLRISAGPWVLRANLTDELGFFSETAGDAA